MAKCKVDIWAKFNMQGGLFVEKQMQCGHLGECSTGHLGEQKDKVVIWAKVLLINLVNKKAHVAHAISKLVL